MRCGVCSTPAYAPAPWPRGTTGGVVAIGDGAPVGAGLPGPSPAPGGTSVGAPTGGRSSRSAPRKGCDVGGSGPRRIRALDGGDCRAFGPLLTATRPTRRSSGMDNGSGSGLRQGTASAIRGGDADCRPPASDGQAGGGRQQETRRDGGRHRLRRRNSVRGCTGTRRPQTRAAARPHASTSFKPQPGAMARRSPKDRDARGDTHARGPGRAA